MRKETWEKPQMIAITSRNKKGQKLQINSDILQIFYKWSNLEPQQDVGGRRVSGQGGSYWVAVHERKVVDQAQGWLEQLEG